MHDDPTGRRNASGAPDPTYYRATDDMRREGRDNLRRCVRVMLAVATAMGCDVTERIALRDRKSGEVSR